MQKELEKLEQTIAEVTHFANHFPRELVNKKPDAKAFSATEIIYHLVEVDQLWQRRIKQLLTTTDKNFQAIDPDALALENRYNDKPFDAGIEELMDARNDTVDLIETMSEGERRIIGTHSKYGEMDTHRIVETIQEHDLQHLEQLKRTLSLVAV